MAPTQTHTILKKPPVIDWPLMVSVLCIAAAGLITMNSFAGKNYFFEHQLVWLLAGFFIYLGLGFVDFRFLRRRSVIVGLFLTSCLVLILVLFLGQIVQGAQSRFNIGLFAIQPSDPVKLVVILILAKYFSRRHIEIAHPKHIILSGFYAFVIALLVFFQPDFGSAVIIALVWFGMVFVSGLSRKHLFAIVGISLVVLAGLWIFVFQNYQKQRILTFLHPYTDVRGAGYNAYQSEIAIGSGGLLGKGVGFGTQSRLQFLPEYETDFIFAAFTEEWGFVGALILLLLFSVIIWRVLALASLGASNFETLFGIGLATLLMSQFVIHVGMNIGLLPVTGVTMPFMSYGGSHLIAEFAGLGILSGMARHGRTVHRSRTEKELPAFE